MTLSEQHQPNQTIETWVYMARNEVPVEEATPPEANVNNSGNTVSAPISTATAIPIPAPDELKNEFSHLDFRIHGKVAIAKHKSENASRMKASDNMLRFIVRYTKTINEAIKQNPGNWILLAQGNVLHLPLSCGWPVMKYKQCKAPKIPLVKIKVDTAFPASIGAEDCGCQSFLKDNPGVLTLNTPMIATGRFQQFQRLIATHLSSMAAKCKSGSLMQMVKC